MVSTIQPKEGERRKLWEKKGRWRGGEGSI